MKFDISKNASQNIPNNIMGGNVPFSPFRNITIGAIKSIGWPHMDQATLEEKMSFTTFF